MLPSSHRPGRMFGSAKTHKFDNYDEITAQNLKLRPIMDQSGTMVYTAAQVVAEYIKPLGDSEFVIKNTQDFPKILSENELQEDEEDISYDVESLFTNVPLEDTIEYILDEIYVHKTLKPICKSRLIMKRFLKRLASDCIFSINGRLLKQIDGCSMGSPLSVILAGIFMKILERKVVAPEKPILYKRFVDDVFHRKKKGQKDTLLPKLNSFHTKIKFTVEKDLKKFLDTKLKLENRIYKTSVNRNKKLPTHWKSKIPKKIKRNVITNDLHRAKKISSDFVKEEKDIEMKYTKAGYPMRFVKSVIKSFKEKEENSRTSDKNEEKTFYPLSVPFCETNERVAKTFVRKIKEFTGEDFVVNIVWKTKKIKSLFKLKDDIKHRANVIYRGISKNNREDSYIGETAQIVEQRWKQHEDLNLNSAPSKHLQENNSDGFDWEVISTSSTNWLRRKIHEALFICKYKPSLNIQVEHKKLILFKNGMT